jgi:hypothetical protein
LNQDLLETVIANPPQAHKGDTEVSNEKALRGSSLTGSLRETVDKNLVAYYGIDSKVARFLHRAVAEGERTLETGSGLSTIIFAIRKAYHTVVTPNKGEVSETYLPRFTLRDLDLELIDGKHSVPWPFIDWFYTAEKLKVGAMRY